MMCIISLLWNLFLIALVVAFLGYLYLVRYLIAGNELLRKRIYCRKDINLGGKTAIVTGSNIGIGYETAKGLAERGARVIMVCRNLTKAEAARKKIVDATGNNDVIVMQCDVSDLESVQKFCKEYLAKEKHLHILVNNAGLAEGPTSSKQGIAGTVATNHFGPFLLTYLLLDKLKESAPSRIVNVSSGTNYRCKYINLATGDGAKFSNWNSYPTTKLINILHIKELARRLTGSNVTAYSLQPGIVLSGFVTPIEEKYGKIVSAIVLLTKMLMLNEFQGAQTSLFCAIDPSLDSTSGMHYKNCREVEPNKLALDNDLARRVWDISFETVSSYTKIE